MRNVTGNTSPYALVFQDMHLMLELFLLSVLKYHKQNVF